MISVTVSFPQIAFAPAAAIRQIKVHVPSSELLQLHTSPKEIIPAPGAGYAIQLLGVTKKYVFGSSFYATHTNPYLYQGDLSIGAAIISIGLGLTTINAPAIGGYNLVENSPVTLYEPDGNPEDGDGTLDVYITYSIITL